jgi:hypothetical protein
MTVIKYTNLEFNRKEVIIERAVNQLSAIIKRQTDMNDFDKTSIEFVIDCLRKGVNIGNVSVLNVEDLVVNGELKLDKCNVYVIHT